MSFIQTEISMSTNLVVLGRPPGRALFNVKSRTLRVLTTVFLLMETILSPWQLLSFFSFFFIFFGARCEDIHQFQDKIWIEKMTYFGVLTHLPHTWSLQNFKCMEFKSPSIVVPSSRHMRCCSRCSSHVRRCCLSVILLDLPLERLGPKIPKGKLYPRTCSWFLLKGK